MEEARKFLDLDMVAEQIRDAGDLAMFREAVQCYHIGSYRAAVILVWIATTNCLDRFLERLHNEGDGAASQAFQVVGALRGTSSYEQTLIDQCRTIELLSDYAARCLTFIRDTRNTCAHTSEVKLSAEAVRYVLGTCAELVLCRREYRGIAFITNLVTTEFASPHFLPNEQRAKEDCRNSIIRVPRRIWHLFVRKAAERNPAAAPEIWQQNARRFFKVLLEECDDDEILEKIASASQRFEAQAPLFAALLVGLEKRSLGHWERQRRDQARVTLITAPIIRPEHIESWATICEHDGLDDRDRDFLRSRLAFITANLPASFVSVRNTELLDLLVEVAEEDVESEQAAAALRIPLIAVLGPEPNALTERLVRQIIERSPTNDQYREVLSNVRTWSDGLLLQFLMLAEPYLSQCSEDLPDDILTIFEAASEFAERIQLATSIVPMEFRTAIEAILDGRLQPEWNSPDSDAGGTLKRQLLLIIERYPAIYGILREEWRERIAAYHEQDEGENENEGEDDGEGN